MSKEVSETKKVNPLVYILGIPLGIYILMLSYNAWEKDRLYRECSKNIGYLGYDEFLQRNGVSFPNCLTVFSKDRR